MRATKALAPAGRAATPADTLVIDKATFPSEPSVPSCAVLYPQTLKLLDELGLDERRMGDESATIRRLVLELDGRFKTSIPMVEAFGRDYVYGIERADFGDGFVVEHYPVFLDAYCGFHGGHGDPS